MSEQPGADIAAGNARQNDYYRALTDRGIDPFAPAGPDADDVEDE